MAGEVERDARVQAISRALRLAGRQGALLTRAIAERLEIGVSDAEGLEIIQGAGPMTPGQLAAALGLTTGAVTGLLDRLEGAGYVRRERDPMDRRKVMVRAVPAKARRLQAMHDAVEEALAGALAALPDEELARAADVLTRAGAVLESHAAGLRSRRSAGAPSRRSGEGG